MFIFKPAPVPQNLAFGHVRRIAAHALTDADIDELFGGEEPIIVTGVDAEWPEHLRTGQVRDVANFQCPPNSVFIDGKQTFGIDTETFLQAIDDNKNVRIFGISLAPEVAKAIRTPKALFDRLDAHNIFRNDDPEPISFIGSGGAFTPLHHDFESNMNWHIVLAGERTVYLWPYSESGRLFKIPIIGLSLISFMGGLLNHRFAHGVRADLKKGDLLYMPARCWHQVQYPVPSLAVTFAFHETEEARTTGLAVGKFWEGCMSFAQGLSKVRWPAFVVAVLMIPFTLYTWLYVPLNFLATLLPGALRRGLTEFISFTEAGLFKLYRPVMAYSRKMLWRGH